MEVIETMVEDSGIEVNELRVDGGASVNNLLMQIQADAIQTKVVRPKITETTALGAAYLAGLGIGFWKDLDDIKQQWQVDNIFVPVLDTDASRKLIRDWKRAVERSKHWYGE
jgi:glycerol kinase